jgi:hypothetical protein
MLERAQTRMLPVANRAADYAPMATACCNACRTCVQTNVVGILFLGAGVAAAFVGRLAKRLVGSR